MKVSPVPRDIRLQFVKGYGFASWGIAYVAGGSYSHVDTVLPSRWLYGARADAHVIDGCTFAPGVRARPPCYEQWHKRTEMVLYPSLAICRRYHDFIYAQFDKPYDSTAIWGFVWDRDWRDSKAWFCSELVAAALEYSEAVSKLCTPKNKVMPGPLALASTAAGFHVIS